MLDHKGSHNIFEKVKEKPYFSGHNGVIFKIKEERKSEVSKYF